MYEHEKNRNLILDCLKEEIIGPSPQGDEVDCNGTLVFATAREAYSPKRQLGSGEEILQRDQPRFRYGAAVLYPIGNSVTSFDSDGDEDDKILFAEQLTLSLDSPVDDLPQATILSTSVEKELQKASEELDKLGDPQDQDSLDLFSANSFRPSSIGITFLCELPPEASLVVEAKGGRYNEKEVSIGDGKRRWWLRSPLSIASIFDVDSLVATERSMISPNRSTSENTTGLDIRIEVFSRSYGDGALRRRLVTVCLVNRTENDDNLDAKCLFQCHLRATILSPDENAHILPYPTVQREGADTEESCLALLYRHAQTYAVGHGCAANWEDPANEGAVQFVETACLPTFEVPSITPQVLKEDRSAVEVSMSALAGLTSNDDGMQSLQEVVDLYEQWIIKKEEQLKDLNSSLSSAGKSNLLKCRECLHRMIDGISYLKEEPTARQAFRFANEAVLLQQLHTAREPRLASYSQEQRRLVFTPLTELTDSNRGRWRPFQIAFLLMNLRSVSEGNSVDRSVVELIWFPTGGGKTEAYLGLSAYAAFMRRLHDKADLGVNILMRYTLRLLTAQQFQRASSLICAMEKIRRRNSDNLGTEQFSIGIWLGGDTTPNLRKDAKSCLHKLQKRDKYVENLFIITKCPWCMAQMGPLALQDKSPGAPAVIGYENSGNTVIMKCPDRDCEFSNRLPIYVIDEDIYEYSPTLIIATVDKYAMLAWKPEARSIFGIGENGLRICSPPNLIIQDELHLISGPLGSMVGLYEGVIEELCTDRRGVDVIQPKIVSSTATIRRYEQQIKGLYARDRVSLFPPPGLSADDSFFAKYARDGEDELEHGTLYVGINAPGLGSVVTAQVRAIAALLQAPVPLSRDERDPWWTLLTFFNNLRELGTSLSLIQSRIPDYLRVLHQRKSTDFSVIRRINNIRELTGRLRSEQVPASIAALEISCSSNNAKPVDICLASNIIEVGIDIDRLSLMCIVGQPKTTSQYIQVTGRIGRKWRERPGLVVTLYSPTRPRDRSHYERFRSYHERLYAQVEPTSVTPFCRPVLERALHAAAIAYVRQAGDQQIAKFSPYPIPSSLLNQFHDHLLARAQRSDPSQLAAFEEIFQKRLKEWRIWERVHWQRTHGNPDLPLLRRAGEYVSPEQEQIIWSTPVSMRNVDAECQVEVTQLYSQSGG